MKIELTKLIWIFISIHLAIGLPASLSAAGDPDIDPPLAALGDPPIPSDNPQTPAKIELGKKLFFDPRIGGDASTACITCHNPGMGWGFSDGISRGYPGTVHWRNSQTVVNSAYYKKLFWAGSAKSLEAQAPSAAKGAVAGNGESDVIEARLALIPEYRQAFKQVFGDDLPKVKNVWRAIASFERTLIQKDTPFDNYIKGDASALDEQQKRGLALFKGKANCIECHNGALISDEKYYNIGVPGNDRWEEDGLAQITFRYELFAKGSTEKMYRKTKRDPGVYFRAKYKKHLGKFRTPSLRYTQYTAPYMHNGTFDTLEEVVEFYNEGGGEDYWGTKSSILKPLELTDEEQEDLVRFLESFSGDPITMESPTLPKYVPLNAIPVKQ